MWTLNFVVDRLNAVMVIFSVAAAAGGIFSTRPAVRIATGLAAIIAALLIPISTRSAFDWTVSTVERTSAPGFLLLAAFAFSAASGRYLGSLSEYRFGTATLIIAGLLLYPGAVGVLNADTYVLGYSGYLLPLLLATLVAYMVHRGYYLSAISVNVGILGFLLSAGRSSNLWDYVVDPIACIIAVASWLVVLVLNVLPGRRPAAAEAS